MDRGKPGRVGNMLLTQRKRISFIPNHVPDSDALRQMEKEVRYPLLRGTAAKHGGKLV
jgi:hypothetical protein